MSSAPFRARPAGSLGATRAYFGADPVSSSTIRVSGQRTSASGAPAFAIPGRSARQGRAGRPGGPWRSPRSGPSARPFRGPGARESRPYARQESASPARGAIPIACRCPSGHTFTDHAQVSAQRPGLRPDTSSNRDGSALFVAQGSVDVRMAGTCRRRRAPQHLTYPRGAFRGPTLWMSVWPEHCVAGVAAAVQPSPSEERQPRPCPANLRSGPIDGDHPGRSREKPVDRCTELVRRRGDILGRASAPRPDCRLEHRVADEDQHAFAVGG